MSGRRRSTSERHLTPEQIVEAAVKIIGKDIARRADVQAIVETMSKMCELSKRTRSSVSKNQKQVARRYGLALPAGSPEKSSARSRAVSMVRVSRREPVA